MRHILPRRISRRAFVLSALAALPAGAVAKAGLETGWVKTRFLRLGAHPTHRLVHFTDLHYRGNRRALAKLVDRINALSPDLVCFTGDLFEETAHLPGALKELVKIRSPLYGVPGNHDYWAQVPFDGIAACFASTGGGWLLDRQVVLADQLAIFGASCKSAKTFSPVPIPGKKNLLLMHYPAWIERLNARFDLVLAGHSHGGQVRIPFFGPLILPFSVDQYDLGLFQTAAGPMYVNPGVGWFAVPLRFNCRPELTVIEI